MSLHLVEPLTAKKEPQINFFGGEEFLALRLSRLIGREQELSSIQQILLERKEVRLLTLTGPGGIGKTRLALAVAESLAQTNEFGSGIFFISLANLRDEQMVLLTLAQALAVPQAGASELAERLKQHLAARGRLLLVLDNCEAFVKVAPQLLDLLAACPELKIMLTSRRLMQLREEYEFNVPPLALPPIGKDLSASLSPLEARNYAAIQLFVERVRQVKPEFSLLPGTTGTITKICHYLEGLPLALELAAPRLKMLSAESLLARLEQRLTLLTTSNQDVPIRQRTMQASIEWSYSLLPASEQTLLKRLSVFAGSWSLEAAEAICKPQPIFEPQNSSTEQENDLLELLWELAAHSLVMVSTPTNVQANPVRYRLLEPIRQYARERLEKEGSHAELEFLQRHHCEYYLNLVETIEPELLGKKQADCLTLIEHDYSNLQAALNWSLTAEDSEVALRLTGALTRYWMIRNQREGQFWLEAALAQQTGRENGRVRAKALTGLGIIKYMLSDFGGSERYFEEALQLQREFGTKVELATALKHLASAYCFQNKLSESIALQQESLNIFRGLNDPAGLASLLNNLGVNYFKLARLDAARQCLEEALTLFKAQGNRRSVANVLCNLGTIEFELKNPSQATATYLEGLAIGRELDDSLLIIFFLVNLGDLAISTGDYVQAQVWLDESLTLCQYRDDKHWEAWAKISLAKLKTQQGEPEQAVALLRENLTFFRLKNDRWLMVDCLEILAETMAGQTELERAVILMASASVQRNELEMPFLPGAGDRKDRVLELARSSLSAEHYNYLWNYGLGLTPEESFSVELPSFKPDSLKKIGVVPEQPRVAARPTGLVEDLTKREIEVLRLAAQGLTNAEIATALTLSKHTVSTHLYSVFSKLAVGTRTAAVHLAGELKLI